jgi:circadian clock protein KaiC
MIRNSLEFRTSTEGSIRAIPTGVPGLDVILSGGLPEYSFNVISGPAGSGKTTLAQQIAFANGTPEHPALYFTVLGEPTLKMLRYQSEYSFFDPGKVGEGVRYVNVSDEAVEGRLDKVLERIVAEVKRTQPSVLVVDSLQLNDDEVVRTSGHMGFNSFVQHLAVHLTSWDLTSFIIGDYGTSQSWNPIFSVADGVLSLSQSTERNSVVRKLQVIKVRGRGTMPGLHTFRITHEGLQVFPRIPEQQARRKSAPNLRLRTGVPGLDPLMGGGIPAGDAVLLGGPAGSGKTTFATHFVVEGLRNTESVVIVVFEEYPEEYLARFIARNEDAELHINDGSLRIIYLRPLDLSVDETLYEIMTAVQEIDATRVVIDSLSGFEVALAPGFRKDFRESLYRLVGALTATGVTIFMTTEIVGGYPHVQFTSEKVSFITDDIIIQRAVEVEGQIRHVVAIHKMRGSEHSTDFLTYEITESGAKIGPPLRGYRGIVTGVAIPDGTHGTGAADE